MSNLIKIVMIYLSINLILYVGGVRLIDNENFLEQFVDIDGGTITGVDDDFKGTVPTTFQEESGLLSFVDALRVGFEFIKFLANLMFTPLGLLFATGLPYIISILIGIPLMIGGVVMLMYFIRSGA